MQKSELETTLRLQNRAYKLLLWLDKHAENRPDFWSEETLRALEHAPEGEAFLRKLNPSLPLDLRSEEEEWAPLSRLVSAFFATSFRIAIDQIHAYDTQTGARFPLTRRRLVARTLGKKTTGQKEKLKHTARELELIALEELAIENDFDLSRAQLEAVAAQNASALHLWSYAHELHRRSQFSSQGESVHQIWRSLDVAQREKLGVETIWASRETLLNAMKGAE